MSCNRWRGSRPRPALHSLALTAELSVTAPWQRWGDGRREVPTTICGASLSLPGSHGDPSAPTKDLLHMWTGKAPFRHLRPVFLFFLNSACKVRSRNRAGTQNLRLKQNKLRETFLFGAVQDLSDESTSFRPTVTSQTAKQGSNYGSAAGSEPQSSRHFCLSKV